MVAGFLALICSTYVFLRTEAHSNSIDDLDSTFYSYDVINIDGDEVPLKSYKGKVNQEARFG